MKSNEVNGNQIDGPHTTEIAEGLNGERAPLGGNGHVSEQSESTSSHDGAGSSSNLTKTDVNNKNHQPEKGYSEASRTDQNDLDKVEVYMTNYQIRIRVIPKLIFN